MNLVLSWPVRLIVVALLAYSLFVDGAGYIYRFVNHYAMTGSAPGLPPHFGDWQVYVHRGLDIQGGTHMDLQLVNVPAGSNLSQVQAEAVSVIERRVNALGVSEPYVAPAGSDRIVVELAGVPAAKAQDTIGRTARLVTTTWVSDPNSTVNTSDVTAGWKPQISPLTSDMVTGANASLDPQTATQWVVNVTLNSSGANIFGDLSTKAYNACPSTDCPNRHIAEWLDLTQDDIAQWDDPTYAAQISRPVDQGGKLLTNPTIQQPITGGQFFIQGSFTQSSAKDLATLLNSGALPATIKVLDSTDVGAALGADAIRKSLAAGLLGLVIVVIFMVAYYRLPGMLASLALLFYAGVVLALFKTIPVTVTLAGMAGFVLSVGMAVDANVLIFERFKEEVRAGRTIAAAVDAAVKRAWPAIRDSNTSTAITSTLLAFLGTGPVRGFAVTLLIGVIVSLLSSIIVTHNLLAIVLNFGWSRGNQVLGIVRG
ncbi:MAG TPA: protein translocase subunit SecD [Candidatus Dormibacteraeota bacterium]